MANVEHGRRILKSSCLVCGFPVPDGYVPACRACRKFFYRNCKANGRNLRCASFTNSCVIGDVNALTVIGSGIAWRMACSSCRYKKCLAVGIDKYCRSYAIRRYFSRASRSSSSASSLSYSECSHTPIASSVTSVLTPSSEQGSNGSTRQSSISEPNDTANPLIARIQLTISQLLVDCEMLPMKSDNEWRFQNELEMFQGLMANISQAIKVIITYLKLMPGFLDLTMKERSFICAKALFPTILAVINRTPPSVLVSSHNQLYGSSFSGQLYNYFPEFKMLEIACEHLCLLLSNWNGNVAEFSCLMATVFLKSYFSCKDETTGDLVDSTEIYDLELAIEMSLQRSNWQNDAQLHVTKEKINSIAGELFEAAFLFNNALNEVLSSRSYLKTYVPSIFAELQAYFVQ